MKSKSLCNVNNEDIVYIVKFDGDHNNVCLRTINYNTVRAVLANSQDYYEKDKWITGEETITDDEIKHKHKSFELEYIFFSDLKSNSKTIPKKNAEKFKYNQMKSTSTRDVYFKRSTRKEWHKYNTGNSTTVAVSRDYTPPKGPEGYWKEFQGYKYYAFSKDKSSMITWFEDDDNLDGIIHEKTYYYRIPKEDFLPKAVNYDFLNE